MRYSTQTLALSKKIGITDAVKAILKAGFPAIDMTMSYGEEHYALDDGGVALATKLRNMADGYGAVFNQAHAPFGGGVDFYLEKTVPSFPRIFEFAAALGAECIVVHPLTLGKYKGYESEHLEVNLDFYTRIAPYARDVGIKIAIENMWEREEKTQRIIPSACDNPCDHARLFDALADPKTFTVCLDVGHTALTGGNPAESVMVLGERLGATHIHDVDLIVDSHTMPGLGKIEWEALVCALGEINYKGYLTLECDKGYLKDVTEENMGERLAALHKCAKSLSERVELYRKI